MADFIISSKPENAPVNIDHVLYVKKDENHRYTPSEYFIRFFFQGGHNHVWKYEGEEKTLFEKEYALIFDGSGQNLIDPGMVY